MFNNNKEISNNNSQNNLSLSIVVEKPGQNPAKVSVPLSMLKTFAKIGNGISGILGTDTIDGIKLDEILSLAESGAVGELVDVVAEDNTHVVISIK